MKVAAIQMVSGTALDDNLRVARELRSWLRRVAPGWRCCRYFCLMGHKDTDKLALRRTAGSGVIQQFLAHTARALQIWIVGGTLPMATDAPDRVRNTTLVFDPTGACVARYDKIHLFRFSNGAEQYDEGRVIDAGDTPVQFDLQARSGQRWRVGLSVCYDLRFPELYRACPGGGRPAAGAAPLRTPRARRTGRCCCVPAR